MICFKKKTRNFTYLCAALLFALLGSFFFCRSAYADTGISTSSTAITYITHYGDSNHTATFGGPATSTNYTTLGNFANFFGIKSFYFIGTIPHVSALSIQLRTLIRFYSWNSSQGVFTSESCRGVEFFPDLYDNTGSIINDLDEGTAYIESCSVNSSGTNLEIVGVYTITFNEVKTIVSLGGRFRNNPISMVYPPDGFLLLCGTGSGRRLCQATSEVYNWPNWLVSALDVSIESTTDPQTAIMWEQLAIQRKEWAQNQQDRQDYTDLDGEGQEEGNDAGDQATNVGNSLLTIFGNFISAVYGIHSTNCMLPDLSYNGVVLRNMNLCSLSIPSPLGAIGSIGLVFILVPLAIHVVNRMINMYKEIFGQ